MIMPFDSVTEFDDFYSYTQGCEFGNFRGKFPEICGIKFQYAAAAAWYSGALCIGLTKDCELSFI